METQEVIHTAIELAEQQGIAPDGVNEKEWLERALRDIYPPLLRLLKKV